jgi:hypothetical protein
MQQIRRVTMSSDRETGPYGLPSWLGLLTGMGGKPTPAEDMLKQAFKGLAEALQADGLIQPPASPEPSHSDAGDMPVFKAGDQVRKIRPEDPRFQGRHGSVVEVSHTGRVMVDWPGLGRFIHSARYLEAVVEEQAPEPEERAYTFQPGDRVVHPNMAGIGAVTESYWSLNHERTKVTWPDGKYNHPTNQLHSAGDPQPEQTVVAEDVQALKPGDRVRHTVIAGERYTAGTILEVRPDRSTAKVRWDPAEERAERHFIANLEKLQDSQPPFKSGDRVVHKGTDMTAPAGVGTVVSQQEPAGELQPEQTAPVHPADQPLVWPIGNLTDAQRAKIRNALSIHRGDGTTWTDDALIDALIRRRSG